MGRSAYLRTAGAAAGLSLLCLSAAVGVVGGSRLAESEVDNSLTGRSLEASGTIEEYFERARVIDLLMANTPSFKGRFATTDVADAANAAVSADGETRRIESVLRYLERIYPTQIGEACVIDRRGVEVARVVNGQAAEYDDLSHDEAQNEFFHAAFALAPGQVLQSAPYVSPDTGEWVVSNSTQIATGDRLAPAIAHFEVTVDSFREQAERAATDTRLMIVDRDSGRILVETGRPQLMNRPLGQPATELSRHVAAQPRQSGVFSIDGQRVAYRAVRSETGNRNNWMIAAATPDNAAPWSTGPGKGAIAAAVGAAVLLITSVAAFRSHQRYLRRQATTDALTGLANRSMLHERLAAALNDRRGHTLSALLLLDLDGFKEVNDTLGHSTGDVLLCEVGARIRSEMRAGDLASRLGGDEFAILLEDVDGIDGIEAAVARLLAAIRRPYRLEGMGVHVDASIGIAIVGTHGDTPELLVQRVDVAMYQAKASRLGWVTYDPDTDPHDTLRLGLTAGLLEAIEERTIELHYQAKIDITTRAVIGAEALVRWTHPDLGPLRPDEFIPVAEKTGLIRPLTFYVLDQALAQCRRWMDDDRHLPVAVNGSAVDLIDERLVAQISQLLKRHNVPAQMLCLEITESAIMAEPDRSNQVLERIHRMGVSLSVDDYGTGYASLTYLRTLPVSELKIDRSFVSGVRDSLADAMIVRSTIELGHSLGMSVVAEGVEDDNVLEYLNTVGCDSAQGYYFARPQPPEEFSAWLDRYSQTQNLQPTAQLDS